MTNLSIDLRQDYYNYVKNEVKRLKKLGFKFPEIKKDTEYEIAEYNNLIERIPYELPRKIYKAKGFSCPEDNKLGLQKLEEDIIAGNSLFKYLSTKIFQSDYSDGMQFDFGIAHFHLGTIEHPNYPELVERTDNVLYAVYTNEAFYFITIDRHGRWNDLKLLEIIQKNFPDLLKMYEINTINPTQPAQTKKQRKKLRRKHINVCIQLNGKTYMSPGGGVAINGFSTKAMFRFTRLMSLLAKLEEEIKLFFVVKSDAIINCFPEILSVEFHYATFTNPLIMFDSNLKYKLEINWDDKKINPIKIHLDRIRLYK